MLYGIVSSSSISSSSSSYCGCGCRRSSDSFNLLLHMQFTSFHLPIFRCRLCVCVCAVISAFVFIMLSMCCWMLSAKNRQRSNHVDCCQSWRSANFLWCLSKWSYILWVLMFISFFFASFRYIRLLNAFFLSDVCDSNSVCCCCFFDADFIKLNCPNIFTFSLFDAFYGRDRFFRVCIVCSIEAISVPWKIKWNHFILTCSCTPNETSI